MDNVKNGGNVMLEATTQIIYLLGQLITQILDNSFSLLLVVIFIALAYVIGGWIVKGIKNLLR